MNAIHPPVVQILLEEALQKAIGNRPDRMASKQSGAFKTYTYTRHGTNSGRLKELVGDDKELTACKVGVFGFAKTTDLNRARTLVKEFSQPRHAMIAVASPKVFNSPHFRAVLTGKHVEVLVEEHENFKVRQLDPWIAKLLETLGKQQSTVAKKSAPNPLDISKRLRDPVTGRLDALKIKSLFGFTLENLATKVCGVRRQNIHQNPTSAGIQEKLQTLEEIAQLLHWCGGDDEKFRAWLKRPKRDFPAIEGKAPSPMDLILLGHAEIVANKTHNLLTGQPA